MDLHGRNDRIVCLGCGRITPRRSFQAELKQLNEDWIRTYVPTGGEGAEMFADGDVDLSAVDFASFKVPSCDCCSSILKPDVVFFGGSVPPTKVEEAFERVREADAVVVAGTSLMVYSGWRFVLDAAKRGTQICVVNKGPTRAESDRERVGHIKIEANCGDVLKGACELLAGGPGKMDEASVAAATASAASAS